MKRLFTLAGGVALGLIGAVSAVEAQPVTAQFWYSFGGKNREVTEAHIKRFNESQAKYRIEGTFQGDYFQALAKIRAAAATKSAPAVFHVVGEALPQLWQSGMFESLEAYARGSNGTDLEDFVPGQTQDGFFDYLGKAPPPLFALPFFRSTPVLYFEIQREVIQPNLEAAVLGIKTAAEIMQAAEARANEILARAKD